VHFLFGAHSREKKKKKEKGKTQADLRITKKEQEEVGEVKDRTSSPCMY
jgi:hypothetical protein